MNFYSDKKLEDLLGSDRVHLTQLERSHEYFDILDTATYAHACAFTLLYKKAHQLHLHSGGLVYTAALLTDELPLSATELHESPLKDCLLAISDSKLSVSIPASLDVNRYNLSTIVGEVQIIQRSSDNCGYLYEIQDVSALEKLLSAFEAACWRPSSYEAYVLHAFVYKKIPMEGNMKEVKNEIVNKDTLVFNDVLLNQLDLMQYALLDFNKTEGVEHSAALEKLNDNIFNFYVLYYGRYSSDESEGLASFAMAVSEIAAEITVFDGLQRHFSKMEGKYATLEESIAGDRARSYVALRSICADFEKENVIAEMRSYLRSLTPEPEAAYRKYCNKQAKKLLQHFEKKCERLKKKRSAKRYNAFYEAFANIYIHMDILGFYLATENYLASKRMLKKYLEAMEDYSLRLNMKMLLKDYQQELELENDEIKAISIAKAGRKELKRLLKEISKIVEQLVHKL